MWLVLANRHTEYGYGVLLGNCSMAIGLALVNAKEFAVTYRRSVEQGLALEEKNKEILFFNRNLEKMVHQKTSEIRSLLDHIPQGVMSLKAGGLVDKDYSKHLAAILETAQIAHENFYELILTKCQMSSDQRDQIWQSIQASLGEDILNYEMNTDKLPLTLRYRTASGQIKILRVTWNAESHEDIVNRIMITLFDATAEHELQREKEEQRLDLEMIQELINITPTKASQFFSTSLPLLRENQRILEETQNLDITVIRCLFVNAHTVKGSARTLQLKQLAHQLHDMEDVYARILREAAPIDLPRLILDAETSMNMLKRYLALNTHTLNRTESFDKVVLDRDFIESHYYFIQGILDGPVSQIDLVERLRSQNEKLTKLIFEQLPAVFEGYRERASKIATDLGKPEPIFDFDIDDVALAPDKKAALDNCMVHILRNALDHGIEPAEERRNAGKNPQGRLRVRTQRQDGFLTITLGDDGRGLALAYIREKALRRGLIHAGSDAEAIAETIFSPGMSTAQSVSEISGRGMGMNAVRSFLEKVGGSIRIELGAPKDSEGLYYEFSCIIHLPLGPMTAPIPHASPDVA